MNPLLNRIYQSKGRKHSQGAKQMSSSIDKTLVPKLNTKVKLQALNAVEAGGLKNNIIKPYIGRLPSLMKEKKEQLISQTEKKRQPIKSKTDFRSRRLSSHMRENETSFSRDNQASFYYPTQQKLKFQSEQQINILPPMKGKLINKQVSPLLTQPFLQQNTLKHKKSLVSQLGENQISLKKLPQKFVIARQQKEEQQQDELFQYLNILQTNPDLNEEFCYMNRKDKPYSFYIVDYNQRNVNQHLTVSLRGVTYYKIQNDESNNQFLTIKQMTKDVYRFKNLKKIPFFKNYAIQKCINHWKISMFKKKFTNQCDYLKQNLFSQNYINLVYFNKLYDLYQQFCKGNFLQIYISTTLPSLTQLKHENMSNQRKQMIRDFDIFEKKVRQALLECLNQNMIKFRKQKRVTLGTSDRLQKSESFLPFDNKKKAMKFTQLAKLKQFEGYLYRIIKYTDLIRYNLKIQYATTALVHSRKQLQILQQNYITRNSKSFISWIECHVQIIVEDVANSQNKQQKIQNESAFLTSEITLSDKTQSKNDKNLKKSVSVLKLSPSVSEIKTCFLEHKQECLKFLWTSHKYLIQDKNDLLCSQFQPQTELPNKQDLKYYLQKTPQLVELQSSFQQTLQILLQNISTHQRYLSQNLLKLYKDSFLKQPIENYLQNQRLKQYLDNYLVQKNIIERTEEYIQFGIILMRVQNFKAEVKKVYDQKYKAITAAIPQQVLKRTQSLAKQVKQIYFKFKQNPQKVKEYIEFYKLYYEQKSKLFLLQKKIQNILQLEAMINKNGIKMPDNAKKHITESQNIFRELQKRFEQIQQNQQKQRKKFQLSIESMIPQIEEKAEDLLKQLQSNDNIQNPRSQITIVMQKISDFTQRFQRLKDKKEQLFLYQIQLKLGHKDLEFFFKLSTVFEWFVKLWNGHKLFLQIQAETKQKGYGQIQNLDILPLKIQLKNIQNAQSDIEALQLLQQFKTKTIRLLHVIKLSKLIATQTFQPEHFEEIKNILTFKVKKIKDLIFTREGSRTIPCDDFYENTNIVQIQSKVSQIAFLSSQQSIIKKKLNQIEQFWKKTKVKFIGEDIWGNGNLISHLDQNEELHQKIGLFNLTLKNIQNSQHAQGPVLQRLQNQIKITYYLRKLFQLWSQVQKQWLKLLPLMTNCPSVKHQSNVYFEFTSVDSIIKKLIKQISDMSSMRKLIEDSSERKNIHILEKCQSQLKSINKIFQNFLQAKRSTYNRFYFLTDEQLILIIENVKDSKSFAKYGGFCFNCQEIDMENELINGFKTQHQIFKLKNRQVLRGQPDQMFKQVSNTMKNSIKSAIRILVPKMKISSNIEQELKQNSLQVCLLTDLLIWSQMSETYLNATSYQQYQLIIKRPSEQMARLLPKINKQLWLKVATRLTQATHLREISEQLIQDQVTKSDFKWKQQIKYSLEGEQLIIRQFNLEMKHGLQYYPPQKVYVPTLNTEKFLNQAYYACLNYKILAVNGHQGQGKRNLIKYTSSRLGIYYKEVVCNPNLKINYLMRFIQGAVLVGAWLSFYECSSLKNEVYYQMIQSISKLKAENKCHDRTLFMLVNHGQTFQKISMFKYNNYSVVEPDHKKICQYLLQMYRFRQWEELAKKILSFLKNIKPLMQNIMGSHLSLIRKIVDGAGSKKINGKNTDNQTLMVVEMIRKQIIDKSEQNIALLLKKALTCYFNIEQQILDPTRQYHQKLGILKQIITKKDSKNIIVIGQRTCKSTLINQALEQLNKKQIRMYPQAQTQFLTSYTIDYLNMIPLEHILIYDGDDVVSQFSDIITSGYLLVQGRKVVIKQKIILQLRNIQNYSPSFIENCQIVYVGNVVSKVQKFIKHCPLDVTSDVFKILEQIFGEQFVKMKENDIETIAKFIKRYKDISQTRTVHKIIIWLLNVLGNEDLWYKNYGGKYTDFTVHQKYLQLVPIDPSRSSLVRYFDSNFYYVPTKSTILITELTNCLLNSKLNVKIYGNQQIGKTSFIKLIKGTKIGLSVFNSTEYWSEHLKDKLLIVRNQGKDYLMPVGEEQNNIKIIVDDLDLGNKTHTSFVRAMDQSQQLRDSKYHKYLLKKFNIIVTSKQVNSKTKADNCFVKIPLLTQNKESLTTIFLCNVEHFVKSHNMNRQVIDYFQRGVLKNLLIAFDDLSNIYSYNIAASHMISILKQLLSIPKKNSYISVQDFSSLFKFIFYKKLTQKSFNKKIKWQLQLIYENVTKITFNNSQQWQYWVNLQSIYKKTTMQEVSSAIKQKFSHLIIYKEMIQDIIFISNSLQGLNSKIAVIGRKGVGKRHISKISASLNKLPTIETLKQAIFRAIKHQPCVLIQQVKKSTYTIFQQLHECQIDGDLQKFLQLQQKQKFRQHLNSSEGFQSVQIITKIKKYVKSIVLVDDKHQYLKICDKFRQFNQFSVCILEEWPIQAIVSVYKTIDNNQKIHAQIFTTTNVGLVKNGLNSMPMSIYEKYIEIFTKIYQDKSHVLQQKRQELTKIYNKFNQSCVVIRQWQQKIATLEQQITQTIEDLSKNIQINKINSFVTSILSKQLTQKQAKIEQQKKEVQNAKKQIQNQVNSTKRILDKIQKIISALQRTEMSELKKIYRTNKLVQFGLQCLCILLKQNGEQINQKTINKILADSNLLMKMKSPDILAVKNSYLIAKFKKEIGEHDHAMKNHTTQTTKILVQWIRSIIQYWQTTEIYNQKRKQFKTLEDQFNKVQADFDKTSSDLKNIFDRSIKMTNQLTSLQKAKDIKQHELTSINKRLQNSAEIIPILLKAEQQIENSLRSIKILLNNLIGNSILVSFTAVFLPLKRLTIKHKLLEQIKKILRQNFIPYSQNFINQIISENYSTKDFRQEKSTVQNLNVFLIQKVSSRIIILVDPQRRAINFLQNYEKRSLHKLLDLIVEKAQDLKEEQFSLKKIYHSVSQSFNIETEKCLLIDWKTIQINPEQKLFNRIAYGKKPEYFVAKQQLSLKVEQNLKQIEEMKKQLYRQISSSAINILDDQKFIQKGNRLIQLQEETKNIEDQILDKKKLIQALEKQIKEEVRKIFILLRLFKEIRPIGLDLILDAALKQGDSIQNSISWALANLPYVHRKGYMIAVVNEFSGDSHQHLLDQIIVNAPIKPSQIKIKKPSLVSIHNWQKLLKVSGYTQNLKQLIQIVQRHQKQFQVWINDYTLLLPNYLCPENLSFCQHLFIMFHLKTRLFPLSLEAIISKNLTYQIKPLKNTQLISQTNKLFPVIYHCSYFSLQKLCQESNGSRMQKIRLGSIRSQSEMKRKIWKCMQNGQWMILYSLTCHQDLDYLQKIVYYVFNYQIHEGFRVILLVDESNDQSNQHDILKSSKYMNSISVNVYPQIPEYLELMRLFDLYLQKGLGIENTLSIMMQQQNPRGSRMGSRNRNRKGSINQSQSGAQISQSQSGAQKIANLLSIERQSLTGTQQNQLKSPVFQLKSALLDLPNQAKGLDNGSIVMNNKASDKFLNRLYKHLLLAHVVILRKHQNQITNSSFQILERSLTLLKYIEENSINIEFNVQTIVNYLQKLYSNLLKLQHRKGTQQIIQRIVDETKFNQKSIYGVSISTISNIQKQLQGNHLIFGSDDSIWVRKNRHQKRDAMKTLDILYNPQDLNEQSIFLRTSLARNPITLANKQIKNENYINFYSKQEKIHNQHLKKTQYLLDWINTYSNKKQNGEQIQPENQYNWQNLLRQTQRLVGFSFNRNQLKDVVNSYMTNLKNTHDLLLYFNPNLTSFTIDPSLVDNFEAFISTYTINYLSKNQVKDAFNYVQNLQFKKISQNIHMNDTLVQYGVDGLILSNLAYRDFKFNNQFRNLEALNDDSQRHQKTPLVIYKLKKLTYSKKQQEELIVNIPIKVISQNGQNNKQKIILEVQLMCNSVHSEFFMRDNSLVIFK